MFKRKGRKLLLGLFSIIILNVMLLFTANYTVSFSIMGDSDEQNFLTIFYDNGREEYSFDEEHMLADILEIDKERQQVNINLPKDAISKLRIDFGNSSGNFEIGDFEIKSSIKTYQYEASELVDHIFETNDTSEITNIGEGSLKIVVNGQDGYICLDTNLSDKKPTIFSESWKMFLIIVIFYIVYCLIVKLLKCVLKSDSISEKMIIFSIIVFFLAMAMAPYCNIIKEIYLVSSLGRVVYLGTVAAMLYIAYTLFV